jgi:Tol biopolymer transport system component/predicted Ser/Thr protein kinase
MDLVPGTCLGRYEVLSLLGSGGMGEVYRARDHQLGRDVALKVLSVRCTEDTARERIDREAHVIARLDHPHICRLYDVGHQDGKSFLVMEYLEGESLADRLSREAIPLTETFRYAIQILEAVEAAHAQGIFHCDLKPSNILITRSGAKLLDFGVAYLHGQAPTGTGSDCEAAHLETMSLAGEDNLIGTIQYMAPERLRGEAPSASSDLFAFGAVLYEMITGRRAFSGADRREIAAAVLTSEPAPASAIKPHLPPSVDALLTRCLAKDPDQRWHSAHDLRLELMWIADERHASGHRSETLVPRRRPAMGFFVGAALVGLVAAGLAVVLVKPAPIDLPSIRFVVEAPEDTTFEAEEALDEGLMSVSPDGHWIAFTATRPGGQRLLWLRALESTEARPLAGTEGAGTPFWSPNSQFIAFFAQGKLKTIDLLGGPPQTLSDGFAGGGGSWSRTGDILFTRDIWGTIVRVPAVGGRVIPVTRLDERRGDQRHAWPQFLPDGRRFLYRVSRKMASGIYLGSVDADLSADQPVVTTNSNVVLWPGHLLFAQGHTLFAQPFDSKSVRFTGEAVPITELLAQNPITTRAHLSASDSGIVIFQAMAPTQLIWRDRRGRSLGTFGPRGVLTEHALAPNSDRVIVSRFDPRTGTSGLWMSDSVRDVDTLIKLDATSDNTQPVWSPNGRQIVFGSGRSSERMLYEMDLSGSNAVPLLAILRTAGATDWSQDGQFLVVEMANTNSGWDLWLLPMTGDRKLRSFLQTSFNERLGRVSPDRRWMAYVSDESGAWEVYVRSLSSVGEKWHVSRQGGTEPRWRGDGKELYYIASGGELMAVPIQTADRFVAGPPETLFQTASTMSLDLVRNHFDVTRDGQRFLFNEPIRRPGSQAITVLVNPRSTPRP